MEEPLSSPSIIETIPLADDLFRSGASDPSILDEAKPLFQIPSPTPFDLNWRMFGVNIRVSPWFWLVSALLGWSAVDLGLQYLVLWVLCVFVSILLHEFGHVLMGRLFGSDGYIVLYSFGGLAVGSKNLSRWWQRVLVSFAGPLAQLALYGVLRLMVGVIEPAFDHPVHGELAFEAYYNLLVINLYWAIMNLIPVWPLDGGQVAREVLEWLVPDRGSRYALGLSTAVAGLLAIHFVAAMRGWPLPLLRNWFPRGDLYLGLLFALLAIGSYQTMQQLRPTRRFHDDEPVPWEKHHDDWDR
jgi:Zn-dependent protease